MVISRLHLVSCTSYRNPLDQRLSTIEQLINGTFTLSNVVKSIRDASYFHSLLKFEKGGVIEILSVVLWRFNLVCGKGVINLFQYMIYFDYLRR